MSYDRADWHYGGDFPAELPPEKGATHIGMFLAWAIQRGLVGQLHLEESADAVQAVRNRQMTGSQFLISQCDAKFTDEDLNDEGNRFANDYYETNEYFDDYDATLGNDLPTLYHAQDTWTNFDLVASVIDLRYREWLVRNQLDID